MPPISRTEKEALESGTVGWDGELMGGNPDWSKLFALKKPELTAEEQAFLDGPVEELCKMLDNWQIQQDNDLPKHVWDFIRQEGFMGLEIPTEYKGKGFSSQAHSAVIMKLSSRSLTGAVTVMVPNSLGPAELINHYGTQEQKDYYLPRLANGTDIPCFALTGPEAGSDATSIPDRGVVCKNEKGELGIRLNWEKRYITLGPVATLIGLAFKMEDPDCLLGDKKDIGITVALVPRDTPGVEIGDRHRPMDLPFQNGPNKGKDVFLPLSSIIGGPEKAGHGWQMLGECLAVGRALSLPAQSVAGAKLMSWASGSYSRVRRQFNMAIGKFEGIEEALGRMAGRTYMMDAARLATVQMVDQDERPTIPSAIVKYHLTEGMRSVVNDAMDIHGGKAVCNGPNNIFAPIYKGIPIAITVEGANIMTRNLIICGQGLIRSHPYMLQHIEAINDSDEARGWKKEKPLLIKHIMHGIKSFGKSVWYGLTNGGGKVPVKDKDTKKYYQQVNRLSAAFNLVADATLLYLASCVLWHYEKQGRPKEELPLVQWACTHALHEAEQAMDKLLTNHPVRAVSMLRPVVFPRGFKCDAPTDKMDALAADCIREPGPMRDKFAAGLYMPTSKDEPLGVLAEAFLKSVETEPLEKKISIALKQGHIADVSSREEILNKALANNIIQQEEFTLLKETDAVRRTVIMVDSFPQTKPAETAAEKQKPAIGGPKV
jgi:acyl-CoA dehydrogenase